MFLFIPCAPSTAVSWLNVCCNSFTTVASLEHLLHLFSSMNLRDTIEDVPF